MEPRSVLDCVQIFPLCTIGRRLLRRFLRIKICQGPLIFAIFLVELLVSASAGATPPLYGIVRGFLGLNSRVYGAYEVDIFFSDSLTHVALLLCFCYFFERLHLFGGCQTQCRPPIVLNPSTTTTSIFSTPRSIFRTLALFLVAKFLFLELHPTGLVSRFVRDPAASE